MLDYKEQIILHSKEDFVKMHAAGKLAAQTLDFITPYVQPGISTDELNTLMENYIREHHSVPAPLGYKGYPKATCISLNHVVCHGIPSDKVLIEGDILNIDVSVILDGWYGDTSRMYWAGEPSLKAKKLCDVTYDAMMRAIDIVRPGTTLGDIGYAIQSYAEGHRYSIVRDFCGHGLGQVFHTAPSVLHYGRPGEGLVLEEGMFFTIEPMVNIGRPEVKVLDDGWTAVTRDKSLSAQYEHAVGVTKDGCEIFSLSPKGHTKPPYLL